MKIRKWMAAALAFAMAGMIPASAFSLSWEVNDEESRRNGRVIPALIMTTSFVTPYRLAFLAQQESKVPVILLPAPASIDRNIYLFIPDGRDAVVIPPDDLSRYISHINAKKVIVLGGTEIVDPRWRSAIEAVFPVQDIDCDRPMLAAQALANSLQAPNILKRYQRLVKQEWQKKKKKAEEKAAAEKAAVKEEKKNTAEPEVDEIGLEKVSKPAEKTEQVKPAAKAEQAKPAAKTEQTGDNTVKGKAAAPAVK